MQQPKTSNDIRQAFLDFFKSKGHEVVASAPLPNYDNPTLLFTNAGMNQFTDLFLGKETRSYSRAATAQKVMRIQGKHNDLENVGPSPRHHTFFEMLGNFSFGDYFKRDAIDYAWEFVTGWLGLEPERLWATIFNDDDESFELWQKYLPAEKILRFDEKDNFWEMGEVGPCGPNSELFYYVGDMETCDPTQLNADDDELFLEFWNLVFMQFERQKDGTLLPLPKPSVDTGLGLERIVRIMQQTETNYETDLFSDALDMVQELLGDDDEQREQKYVGYRVIADHGRAATFLIGDGLRPGSSGAGYVLRMIIRRAARFGREIGFERPFLSHVARVFIENMGDAYPDLKQRSELIYRTLQQEEERFAKTLDAGLERLQSILAALRESGETEIHGETAFDLYATFGLPLEITRDVVQEQGFTVDEDGFVNAREAHAVASGSGAFSEYETGSSVYGDLLQSLVQNGKLDAAGVEYDPYSGATLSSEIVGLIADEQSVASASGGKLSVVTAETIFYVESGGEVSDTGWITSESGARFRVDDTRRPVAGLVVHIGELEQGKLNLGDPVTLEVDDERRGDIRRNHTATHVLHKELRAHLGTHVAQAGSLVAPDRLRFDFTHDNAVSDEELAKIETSINEAIIANYPVRIEYMGQKEAIESGAMALFGEKYGDIVRTVILDDDRDTPAYSFELCGGLHVAETNDIGLFRFTGETAVSAGVRRVEAVTGRGARELIAERLNLLDRLAGQLNSPIGDLETRLASLLEDNRDLQKQLSQMQEKIARVQFESLKNQAVDVQGVSVLAAQVDGVDVDGLRQIADWFRDVVEEGTAVLATVKNDRPVLIAAVTKNLIPRGVKAGDLVREVAKMVGGGGGGRPDMAQAGGRDASKLPEALGAVAGLVEQALKN